MIASISHLTSINHCLIWSCICSFMSGPSVSASLSLMLTRAYTRRVEGSRVTPALHIAPTKLVKTHFNICAFLCISGTTYLLIVLLILLLNQSSLFLHVSIYRIASTREPCALQSLYLLCDANHYTQQIS